MSKIYCALTFLTCVFATLLTAEPTRLAFEDLHVVGAEPLILHRHLTPDGWRFFYHLIAKRTPYNTLAFEDRNGNPLELEIDPLIEDSYTVSTPDGSLFNYSPRQNTSFLFLDLEKRPNGNCILYTYDAFNRLIEIKTTNPSQDKIYTWAHIQYHSCSSKSRDFDIETSDGKHYEYRFEPSSQVLTKVEAPSLPRETLTYYPATKSHPPLLKQRILAGETVLQLDRNTPVPPSPPPLLKESPRHTLFFDGTQLPALTFNENGTRTFYDYNIDHILIAKITDDGTSDNRDDLSGVTKRTITRYILRTEEPFLNLVSEAIESIVDLNTLEEMLQKKVTYTYSPQGYIIKEDHYDATHTYRYSIHREYDPRGRLIKQTNAAGQAEIFRYDICGNLIQHIPFHRQFKTVYTYDQFGNRLATHHFGLDGSVNDALVTQGEPQAPSFLAPVAPCDTRTITFTYDSLGRVARKTTEGDGLTLHEHFEWDLLNRLISEWQENGEGALLTKNLYAYDAAGHLTKHTSWVDGAPATHRYTYDPWGHLILHIDPNGNMLTPEEVSPPMPRFEPPPCHQQRVTEVPLGEGVAHLAYDAFGHVSTITLPDRSTIHYVYDPLFLRTIERYNALGELLYVHTYDDYDLSGNCLKQTFAGNIVAMRSLDRCGQVLFYTMGDMLKQRAHYNEEEKRCVLHTATPFAEITAKHPLPLQNPPFDLTALQGSYDAKGNQIELTVPGPLGPVAYERNNAHSIPVVDIAGTLIGHIDPRTNQLSSP